MHILSVDCNYVPSKDNETPSQLYDGNVGFSFTGDT